MISGSDNTCTGYALDSGCPKTLWLPPGRVSQQYPSTAPGAYPEAFQRPIGPAAEVSGYRAVRHARWTGDEGRCTLRKQWPPVATATYGGYLSQVHTQYTCYRAPATSTVCKLHRRHRGRAVGGFSTLQVGTIRHLLLQHRESPRHPATLTGPALPTVFPLTAERRRVDNGAKPVVVGIRLANREESGRNPSWPGVLDSTKGRIHWRRPTVISIFRLQFCGGPYIPIMMN